MFPFPMQRNARPATACPASPVASSSQSTAYFTPPASPSSTSYGTAAPPSPVARKRALQEESSRPAAAKRRKKQSATAAAPLQNISNGVKRRLSRASEEGRGPRRKKARKVVADQKDGGDEYMQDVSHAEFDADKAKEDRKRKRRFVREKQQNKKRHVNTFSFPSAQQQQNHQQQQSSATNGDNRTHHARMYHEQYYEYYRQQHFNNGQNPQPPPESHLHPQPPPQQQQYQRHPPTPQEQPQNQQQERQDQEQQRFPTLEEQRRLHEEQLRKSAGAEPSPFEPSHEEEEIDVSSGAYNEKPSDKRSANKSDASHAQPDPATATESNPVLQHHFVAPDRLMLNVVYGPHHNVAFCLDLPQEQQHRRY